MKPGDRFTYRTSYVGKPEVFEIMHVSHFELPERPGQRLVAVKRPKGKTHYSIWLTEDMRPRGTLAKLGR